METIRGKVSNAGRVVLPVELRRHFGIEDGTEIVFCRGEYGIQIMPVDQAIRQAQELCSKFALPGVSMVDELIRERREEAARE